MGTLRFSTGIRHGLAWLVWLALLLPMAQTLALRHGVSHLAAGSSAAAQAAGLAAADAAPGEPADAAPDTTPSAPNTAPHTLHCELCLTATATAALAPPAPLAPLLLAALQHAAPAPALVPGAFARASAGYRSRAPPPTLH